MQVRLWGCAAAAAAIVLVGCDRLGTDAKTGPTDTEARAVAEAVDDDADVLGATQTPTFALAADETPAPSSTVTTTTQFTLTRTCPKGGAVRVSGTRTVTANRTDRTWTMDLAAVHTYDNCSRTARAERDTFTLTLNGRVDLTSHHEQTTTTFTGRDTQKGTVDWRTSTGRSGTCPIDLVSEFRVDRSTGTVTRTVKGTVCSRTIDITRTIRRSG